MTTLRRKILTRFLLELLKKLVEAECAYFSSLSQPKSALNDFLFEVA